MDLPSWEKVKPIVIAVGTVLILILLAVGISSRTGKLSRNNEARPSEQTPAVPSFAPANFERQVISLNPEIGKDFSFSEIQNINDMGNAFGVTFTPEELKLFADNKFVVKNLLSTSIRPQVSTGSSDWYREFTGLYNAVRGPVDYKERKPENALFFSADGFLNEYSILFTELLKETENKVFYPAVKSLSEAFYKEAEQKLASATSPSDKQTWLKVRNYFSVPYSIFSTATSLLTQENYYGQDGSLQDPEKVAADLKKQDTEADTYDKSATFIKNLHLDSASEQAVLGDLKRIYDAQGRDMPGIFKDEYETYAQATNVRFMVDFTQFTPRSHYTSSSLRRQYSRGMTWFNQLPFFLKNKELTDYSFAISAMLAQHPEQKDAYQKLDTLISFLVGGSDDLTPIDYAQAIQNAGPSNPQAAIEYLMKAREPKIKNLPAVYPTVGEVQTSDVVAATKGMRFFSGKFILDSYWTGRLTQGDEAPRPGYTQKLPPMASSLEVMSLLGSEYAKTQIPNLDFYKPANSKAITQALAELEQEMKGFDDQYWQQSAYSTSLWTIKGLFGWFQSHRTQLPRFMQSPLWDAKTLMTASGFWTELRHATLLYAKQSFAELGGGGPDECDSRPVPQTPISYVESQPDAYDRLIYLTRKTARGYQDQGIELKNLNHLQTYISLLEIVRDYSKKQLENTQLNEKVVEHRDPDPEDQSKTCVSYSIEGDSDREILRRKMVDLMEQALPEPVEGPVLPAKDKRAALVADVHTGGDSANPHRILYEGIGVPRVIFVAVKDINGPRLTVGFTYSHYEFTEPYGGKRLTDEEWQKKFYTEDDPYNAFKYTPVTAWPEPNFWYKSLLRGK